MILGVRILILLAAMSSSIAMALLPPHVRRVSPGPGEFLQSRIVKFYGYSLEYAPDPLVTATADGQAVAFESFMWTRQECRGRPGPCPPTNEPVATGAEQTLSVLSIKLPAITADASYEVRVVDQQVRVMESEGRYRVAPAN